MKLNPAIPSDNNTGSFGTPERSKWFDDLIGTIRSHELQLDTNTASPDLSDFYKNVFAGQMDDVLFTGKQTAKKYFVSKIVVEYLNLIKGYQFSKLAFDHNDSEVLVWAEIPDGDDKLEKNLILNEAEINAKYHNFGFHLCSIIVEQSEELPIPNHYKKIK